MTTRVPTVVAALFDGLPEWSFLRPESFRPITLLRWADRSRILSELALHSPNVLLLPPFDAQHVATGPLIERYRRAFPDLLIALVTQTIGGVGAEVATALRLGCPILHVQSAAGLREAVLPLVRGVALSEQELRVVAQTLSARTTVRSAAAELLQSVLELPASSSVDDFARKHGVSRRTLTRCARREFGVTPMTMMLWARILRTALLAGRHGTSAATAVRAAGFRSMAAYAASLTRVGLAKPAHPLVIADVDSVTTVIGVHLNGAGPRVLPLPTEPGAT